MSPTRNLRHFTAAVLAVCCGLYPFASGAGNDVGDLPVGWWLSSPEADAILQDAGAGRHDGRILSASVRREGTVTSGAALVFDGKDDETVVGPGGFAIVPLPGDFDLSSGFSLALWVRPDATSAFAPLRFADNRPEIFTDGFCIYSSMEGIDNYLIYAFCNNATLSAFDYIVEYRLLSPCRKNSVGQLGCLAPL